MPDMLTIRQSVIRLKVDGLPVSEHTLRLLVKRGAIPVRYAGQKALVFYPNLVRYLQCEDGADNQPVNVTSQSGFRRVM